MEKCELWNNSPVTSSSSFDLKPACLNGKDFLTGYFSLAKARIWYFIFIWYFNGYFVVGLGPYPKLLSLGHTFCMPQAWADSSESQESSVVGWFFEVRFLPYFPTPASASESRPLLRGSLLRFQRRSEARIFCGPTKRLWQPVEDSWLDVSQWHQVFRRHLTAGHLLANDHIAEQWPCRVAEDSAASAEKWNSPSWLY